MRNLLYIVGFALLLVAQTVKAQPAVVTLKSDNGLPFYLALNDTLLDSIPHEQYILASAYTRVKNALAISDSLVAQGTTSLSFTTGKWVTYDVLQLGNTLQFLTATSNPIDSLDATTEYYPVDSLAYRDTIILADSLEQAFYIKEYGGNTGCIPPLTDRGFEQFMQGAQAHIFSKNRLRYFLEEIPKQCLRVQQVNQIWPLFDFDEPKLEIVQILEGHLFNPADAYDIEPKLIADKNKLRFQEVIKTLSQD